MVVPTGRLPATRTASMTAGAINTIESIVNMKGIGWDISVMAASSISREPALTAMHTMDPRMSANRNTR